MNQFLTYPFDPNILLKKRKSLKKELLEQKIAFIEKNIAILGGSTTHDIKDMLELFLLGHGIKARFYESEYAQFWQDAMFENQELDSFSPDIIFIHTTNRNIIKFPDINDETQEVIDKLENEYRRYATMWDTLKSKYHCPIIQNNFEYPFYRLMGNREAYDIHGKVHYITSLNMKFSQYAQENDQFFINDINYLSAYCGLEEWSDPFYWHMYKYAVNLQMIPYLAHSVANIIKSIYGKNKKAFALDLDNTLWGGVIGDDGVEHIEIGQETSMGQVFSEFQEYLKQHKKIGVILNIISKNDECNAIAGLNHPDSILKPEDFISIKANWEPKSKNLEVMAEELSLLPESFVFVDDNPAEREIVCQQIENATVPSMLKPEQYIKVLDRSGFFEVTNFSQDDLHRDEMYKKNAERRKVQASFADYHEYLSSLEMTSEIKPFDAIHMSRIAQLTNKSNQFNLTTRRYTQEEIEKIANNPVMIPLYGNLKDKFGDNGVVTVVIGEQEQNDLHIRLWLMSCRVLKRDMEFAMMDEVVRHCKQRKINRILGYYYPTAKNGMVKDFYQTQGFTKLSEDENGNTIWEFCIDDNYVMKNTVISVNQ